MKLLINGCEVEVTEVRRQGDRLEFEWQGEKHSWIYEKSSGRIRLEGDGPCREFIIHRAGRDLLLSGEGGDWRVSSVGAVVGDSGESDGVIKAPLPGRVVEVNVKDGQDVAEGDALLSIEAMKMEHRFVAPCSGTVRLAVAQGDVIADGQLLLEVE